MKRSINSNGFFADSRVTKSNDFSTVNYVRTILEKAYRDLMAAICNDGIMIFAEAKGPCSFLSKNETGAFEIDFNGLGPRILVANKRRHSLAPKQVKSGHQNFVEFADAMVADATDDLQSAIYTLAHEYGHYQSYKAGTRTVQYEEALNLFNGGKINDLTVHQKELILKEEEIAWANGKTVIDQLYVVDQTSFEARRDNDLHVYREMLSIIQSSP